MFGLLFGLLSGVRQYLGELYELPTFARIGKGMLSLCFKRNGNYLCMAPPSPFILSHHSQNPVTAPHPIYPVIILSYHLNKHFPTPFHFPVMTSTSLPGSCHSHSPFILSYRLNKHFSMTPAHGRFFSIHRRLLS